MPVAFSSGWPFSERSTVSEATADSSDAAVEELLKLVRRYGRVLAIGDVQAGKTSMYVKLLKALHASDPTAVGLVLTSSDTGLKNQTQVRLYGDVPCYMKNTKRLKEALSYVEAERKKNPECFVLIVDDEGDHASPNNKALKNRLDKESNATKVHSLVSRLVEYSLGDGDRWAGCYLPVTATPAAVLLANRESSLSPDVAFLLEEHEAYYSLTDAVGTAVKFPEGDLGNIDALCDSTLAYYLVSCAKAAEVARCGTPVPKWPEIPQIMIHASRKIRDHADVKTAFTRLVGLYIRDLEDAPALARLTHRHPRFVAALQSACTDLEYGLTDASLQSFAVILKSLAAEGGVVKANGDVDIALETYRESRCVIGGTMLSRGITLPGLIVSAFFRATSENSPLDTVAQWARFCGPRKEYAAYCRVLAPQSTYETFECAGEQLGHLKNNLRAHAARNSGIIQLDSWRRVFLGNAKTITRRGAQGIELRNYELAMGWNTFSHFTKDAGLLREQRDKFECFLSGIGIADRENDDEGALLGEHGYRQLIDLLVYMVCPDAPRELSMLPAFFSDQRPVRVYLPGPREQERNIVLDERTFGRINNLFSGSARVDRCPEREYHRPDEMTVHFRRIHPTKEGARMLPDGLYQVMGAVYCPFASGVTLAKELLQS